MRIDGSNNALLARAYGINGARPAQRVQPAAPVERGHPTDPLRFARTTEAQRAYGVDRVSAPVVTKAPTNAERLVAARVPGGIDFTADGPTPRGPSLPLYRHPADKNAAAVSVEVGRSVDIAG